jgi:uncharacterized protein (TIGR02145 family)
MKKYELIFTFMTFIIFNVSAQFNCGDTLTDSRDGQKYPTTLIGDQCWLAKNLNIGTMLDVSSANLPQSDNSIIEKYCYNNDLDNCKTYGGLYQWDELMNYSTEEITQGICPSGWHIPSVSDYDSLIGFLPQNKTIQELIPGGSSGFNLLFSGYCYYSGSKWLFQSLGGYVNLRTSTIGTMTAYAYVYYSYPSDSLLYKSSYPNRSGYSARCIYYGPSGISKPGHAQSEIWMKILQSGNEVRVNYLLPEGNNYGKIRIINVSGIIMREKLLNSKQGTINFDITGLDGQLLFIRLETSSGKMVTSKFIVP